jgi:1-hydroxycarotenoid 3,4-desaturase
MLIAHVEQQGVWTVGGGMHAVARGLEKLACSHGAEFRYGHACRLIETSQGRASGVMLDTGERIAASRVLANCDPSAIGSGMLGAAAAAGAPVVRAEDRSLSALCWVIDAPTEGFPLSRHNVFFSGDYAQEFSEMTRSGRPARDATVYVCAQDRDEPGADFENGAPERLQIIVNAPARGDTDPLPDEEIAACQARMFDRLVASGLRIETSRGHQQLTTPAQFDRLFPATGGALYGRATHGWAAAFRRPGARTAIPGLYLAGGATHPGAGVPMAALSGCRAAESILADSISTRRYRPAAIDGGISMRSATTAGTG